MQPHKQGYRRLICLLLCVAMMLSLGVTAFAGNADPSYPSTAERNLARDSSVTISADHSTSSDVADHLIDGTISARVGWRVGCWSEESLEQLEQP